jgi:ADP-ribosylglycohydrolase
MSFTDATNRARGALTGLAIGDALGMPTQYLSRASIAERYGVLSDFEPAPDDNEISRGMPAGRVTDDTDQAVILGTLLVEGRGRVDPERFARQLLAWEKRMREAGSADLLGPSTLKALSLVADGVPTDRTGRWGDTNGASMRIAPVGVAIGMEPLAGIVDVVEQVSHVTHNTGIAIAGASAIAAAVSAGIDGLPLSEALALAVDAAEIGNQRGHYVAGPDIAARISWALGLVRNLEPDDAMETIYRLVGVGVATQEAIPAALAMASLFPEDPWAVCRYAASLGGDCDTIAAMAGAVVGASTGLDAFPLEVREKLEAANPELRLNQLADDLLELRRSGRASTGEVVR